MMMWKTSGTTASVFDWLSAYTSTTSVKVLLQWAGEAVAGGWATRSPSSSRRVSITVSAPRPLRVGFDVVREVGGSALAAAVRSTALHFDSGASSVTSVTASPPR